MGKTDNFDKLWKLYKTNAGEFLEQKNTKAYTKEQEAVLSALKRTFDKLPDEEKETIDLFSLIQLSAKEEVGGNEPLEFVPDENAELFFMYLTEPAFMGVYIKIPCDEIKKVKDNDGNIEPSLAMKQKWYWAALYNAINYLISTHKDTFAKKNNNLYKVVDYLYPPKANDGEEASDEFINRQLRKAIKEDKLDFIKRCLLCRLCDKDFAIWTIKGVKSKIGGFPVLDCTEDEKDLMEANLERQNKKVFFELMPQIRTKDGDLIASFDYISLFTYPYVAMILENDMDEPVSGENCNGRWEEILHLVARTICNRHYLPEKLNEQRLGRLMKLYKDAHKHGYIDTVNYEKLQQNPGNIDAIMSLLLDHGYLVIMGGFFDDYLNYDEDHSRYFIPIPYDWT